VKTDFVICLKLAEEAFEQYKEAQPKWWRRMAGTPILNDVAVLMAEKFNSHIYGLENCMELNTKLLLKRAADALEHHQMVTGEIIIELRKAAE